MFQHQVKDHYDTLKRGFGERVDTFFRQGYGTTLGVQPWEIAREL